MSDDNQLQTRDLRLDLFRGIALLVIATNHLPGNPMRRWTPIAWGYSDMAEVFLFLSGYVCGLSIRKHSESSPNLFMKFWGRAAQLYIAYIVTGYLLVAFVRSFQIAAQLDYIGEALLSGTTGEILQRLCMLDSRVSHLCILLLYVLLLAVFPIFLLCSKQNPQRLWLLSTVLYLLSQLLELRLPEPWRTAFYYNPFAWQWIFMTGISLSLLTKSQRLQWLESRYLVATAFVGLIGFWLTTGIDLGIPLALTDKANLGVLRAIHFACCAILIRILIPRNFSERLRQCCEPVLVCGRQSLITYCSGALAAVVITYSLSATPPFPLKWTLANLSAWTLCMVVADCVERFKSFKNESKI